MAIFAKFINVTDPFIVFQILSKVYRKMWIHCLYEISKLQVLVEFFYYYYYYRQAEC